MDYLAMLIGLSIVTGILVLIHTGFTAMGIPAWVSVILTLLVVAYLLTSIGQKK